MKRYLPFAIIAAVAALTIIASAMLYQAKKPLPLSTASAPPPPMEKSVPVENSMLAGKSILEMTGDPEKEHVRGGAQAPVTLEVFGDFQCPSCATASSAISKLEQDYGPRLRVVYRQFPLSMHAHAMDAALAAEAAGL